MTKKRTLWLLCVALVLILAAGFALAACAPKEQVTATFAGGAGATGTAPAPIVCTIGDTITLPRNTFSRTNHTFSGWSDGNETYNEGDKYKLKENTTFFAQWTPNASDIPFTTEAFNGWLIYLPDNEHVTVYHFTDTLYGSSKGVRAGEADRYIVEIDSEEGNLDGSYTIDAGGTIIFYKDDSQVGAGAIHGKTMAVTVTVEDQNNKEQKVSAASDMYSLIVTTAEDNTMSVFANEGLPVMELLDLMELTIHNATITFNGTNLDFTDEQETWSARAGYTEMPAKDSIVTITLSQTPPPVTYYKLSFELGDHPAAYAVKPRNIYLKEDDNVTLPPAVPAADGWTFVGWSDGEETYPANFTFSFINIESDMTFVAQYKKVSKLGDYAGEWTAPIALQFGSYQFDGIKIDGQAITLKRAGSTYDDGIREGHPTLSIESDKLTAKIEIDNYYVVLTFDEDAIQAEAFDNADEQVGNIVEFVRAGTELS